MEEKNRFVKGLKGLGEILGVSIDNAFLLVKSGKLDKAIIMIGKKRMLFDIEKVYILLTKSNIEIKKGQSNGE